MHRRQLTTLATRCMRQLLLGSKSRAVAPRGASGWQAGRLRVPSSSSRATHLRAALGPLCWQSISYAVSLACSSPREKGELSDIPKHR